MVTIMISNIVVALGVTAIAYIVVTEYVKEKRKAKS